MIELELKYDIKNYDQILKILKFMYKNKVLYSFQGSRKYITYYLDTKEYNFKNEKIAFRVRKNLNNNKILLSVKGRKNKSSNLIESEELNVDLTNFSPNTTLVVNSIFKENNDLENEKSWLYEVCKDKRLNWYMQIYMNRLVYTLYYKSKSFELTFDICHCISKLNHKRKTFLELEIEMMDYKGKEDEKNTIGMLNEMISKNLQIDISQKSKIEKCLQLLEQSN